MLEQLGCRADLAGNGQEALEALKRARYDIVLMDVQMPVVNGLEATRAIRRGEAGTSRHLPILALTAHAMESDRRRCLEVGMDGYLAKPIKKRDLRHALSRWSRRAPAFGRSEMESPKVRTNVAHDEWLDHLRSYLGDDMDSMSAILHAFRDEVVQALAELERAQANEDAPRVVEIAHGLKGISMTVGARTLAQWWRDLDGRGREGDFDGVGRAIDGARKEWARFGREIEGFWEPILPPTAVVTNRDR